ncbi:hypothetical protein Goari_001139 [Gossypium aridum]|uniref:Uncharacterized protein n=1 Tax=Gossypium aridum TaxID=34290 RepID=A0A7J8YKK4_GOSAI|nr:hypothetical protein [Gossypium aridum]
MNSRSRSSDENECPEESSWTLYFQDFSNKNTIDDLMNQNSSSILSHISHHTPDAACSAAGPLPSLDHTRLSFKKRKIKGPSSAFIDHDLEDTATSPANSPKVYNLGNQFDKQKDDAMGISQEMKGSGSGKINDEVGFIEGENVGHKLKKKGLCLVPLSMVLHYLG